MLSRITHVPARLDGQTVHIPLCAGNHPAVAIIMVMGRRSRLPVGIGRAKFATNQDAFAAGFTEESVDPRAFGGTWKAMLRQRKRYTSDVEMALGLLGNRPQQGTMVGRGARLRNRQLSPVHPLHDQPDAPRTYALY
jgi:hypothetical protein